MTVQFALYHLINQLNKGSRTHYMRMCLLWNWMKFWFAVIHSMVIKCLNGHNLETWLVFILWPPKDHNSYYIAYYIILHSFEVLLFYKTYYIRFEKCWQLWYYNSNITFYTIYVWMQVCIYIHLLILIIYHKNILKLYYVLFLHVCDIFTRVKDWF